MNIQSVAAAYTSKPISKVIDRSKKTSEKSAAPTHEQVELSATSQSMQKVQDAVKSTPEVRIDLVEKIQNKIRHNGYPLESNIYKAMEKMVNERIL